MWHNWVLLKLVVSNFISTICTVVSSSNYEIWEKPNYDYAEWELAWSSSTAVCARIQRATAAAVFTSPASVVSSSSIGGVVVAAFSFSHWLNPTCALMLAGSALPRQDGRSRSRDSGNGRVPTEKLERFE